MYLTLWIARALGVIWLWESAIARRMLVIFPGWRHGLYGLRRLSRLSLRLLRWWPSLSQAGRLFRQRTTGQWLLRTLPCIRLLLALPLLSALRLRLLLVITLLTPLRRSIDNIVQAFHACLPSVSQRLNIALIYFQLRLLYCTASRNAASIHSCGY